MWTRKKPDLPTSAAEALPGRDTPIPVRAPHAVLGTSMTGPWPQGHEVLYVAMGCFWGAERLFWQLPGVWTTAAGYAGGHTPNPTYEETCTGLTGHTEAVLVVYDPQVTSFEQLMKTFWENHDPTQLNGQGNDRGTQYRTAIYPTTPEQLAAVEDSRERYQRALSAKGYGDITTEIRMFDDDTVEGPGPWYYAEDYHQQYLHKNPRGYCNHGFCQVAYDVEAHGQVARAELPGT